MALEILEIENHEILVGTELKVDGVPCKIVRTLKHCAVIQNLQDGRKWKQLWMPMAEALGIEVKRT